MTRFSVTLAAAAASAVVATGVMALQAVGDDQAPSRADAEKRAQCLRTERDEKRCNPDPAAGKPGVAPEELLACLRAHGLNPPTDPVELKPWILRTPGARACIAEPPKEADSGCGEKKPDAVSARRSGSARE
jgi:hypothetical protein